MMSNPKTGDRCRIHYRKSMAAQLPLHGKVGVIAIASRGRPRNHGVLIDGIMYVVPAGNLEAAQ